jgi:transposase InsO family protein
VAYFS